MNRAFDPPFRLSAYFESCGRCKIQEDERDVSEVLIFDEIEDTVEAWLRTIIQRLEREQTAIRRDHHRQPTPSGETLRGTPLYRKHHPKCASRSVRLRRTDGGKLFRFRAGPVLVNSCEGDPALLALIPRTLLAQSSRSGLPTSCNGLCKLVGIRLDRCLCDEWTFSCLASDERPRFKIGRTLIWLRRHPQV